jgi:hypothetical protein
MWIIIYLILSVIAFCFVYQEVGEMLKRGEDTKKMALEIRASYILSFIPIIQILMIGYYINDLRKQKTKAPKLD